jgi:hypothetical protein
VNGFHSLTILYRCRVIYTMNTFICVSWLVKSIVRNNLVILLVLDGHFLAYTQTVQSATHGRRRHNHNRHTGQLGVATANAVGDLLSRGMAL